MVARSLGAPPTRWGKTWTGQSSLRGPRAPGAALILLVWLGVALGFVLLRTGPNIGWDDTSSLQFSLKSETMLQQRSWDYVGSAAHQAIHDFATSGYRPLSQFITFMGIKVHAGTQCCAPSILWLAGVGAVIGALGVAYFALARDILGSGRYALVAAVLFLASAPFVAAAFVIFAGIQAFVPLLITAGIYAYRRIRSGNDAPHRSPWIAVFAVVCLIGPWLREFVGLLPALVLWSEALHQRPSRVLLALSAVALMHSIYPSFLPALLLSRDIPVSSIFAMGSLGTQIDTQAGSFDLFGNRSVEVPMHLVSLLPPSLCVTGGIIAVLTLAGWARGSRARRSPRNLRGTIGALLPTAALVALIVVDTTNRLLLGWFDPSREGWTLIGQVIVPLVLLAAVATGAPHLLIAWAVAALLPFLRVYTEDVHLVYALAPFVLLVLWVLRAAQRHLALADSPGRRAIRLALGGVVLVAAGDQTSNLLATRAFAEEQTSVFPRVAKHMSDVAGLGDMVITNALHPQDFALYAHQDYTLIWTVSAGTPRPEVGLMGPPELEVYLTVAQPRTVYILDVDQNYRPDTFDYHHQWIARTFPDTITPRFEDSFHVRYLSIDPLRRWYDRRYIPFVGPPDTTNDFGTEPGSSYPYVQATATYRFGQVDLDRLRGVFSERETSQQPVQLEANYSGYNIMRYAGHFYAIQRGDGEFDYQRFRAGSYAGGIVASTKKSARELINAKRAGAPGVSVLPGAIVQPQVVRNDVWGYRVFSYGTRYFAVPKEVTSFDYEQARSGAYGPTVEAGSVGTLALLLSRGFGPNPSNGSGAGGSLIAEGYAGYNLVQYGTRFYAVAQSEGSFSPERAWRGMYPSAESVGILEAKLSPSSSSESRMVADEHPDLPALIESTPAGFNIVRYDHRFYVVRQGDGAFSPERAIHSEYPSGTNLAHLEAINRGGSPSMRSVPRQ